MGVFAIFNYQFGKIVNESKEGHLFSNEEETQRINEAFENRQEIFDDIIDRDFLKEDIIHFCNKYSDKEYIHRYVVPPTDNISVMRLANKRSTTIVNEQLKERQEDDYPNCLVIIDNRKGIQYTKGTVPFVYETLR